MTDGNVVEFETVHRRFGEAVEALKQLSELMGGLRDAEKVKERTAAAISDASDHLRDTSATLTSYCELLRSALDTTLEALQSAENLATGAELTAIRTEVASNRAALTRLVDNDNSLDRKLTDLANRQSTITDTVDAIRNKLDGDLSQAQQSRDSALAELEALQSAENLATGAELTAIRTEVTFNRAVLTRLVDNDNSLDRKLADLANRQSTITDTVDAIRNKLDGDLSQAQQSRDSALSELTETKSRLDRLESRLSDLPPKIRRKYDLDNP